MQLVVLDLVPRASGETLSVANWRAIQFQLSEFQPASGVELIGDPAHTIRVWSLGGGEVAPGLLARVEELAGARLRIG